MFFFSTFRLTRPQVWEFGLPHQRLPEGRQEVWFSLITFWGSTKELREGRSHTFPVTTARARKEWTRSVQHG